MNSATSRPVWGAVAATRQGMPIGYRYRPLLRKLQWQDFLRAEWEVCNDPDESFVRTPIWAHHLVIDNIVPMLQQANYVLKSTPKEFLDCVLNHMFRHEVNYCRGGTNARPTPYRCNHAGPINADRGEFFHQRKLPTAAWQRLRNTVAVEHWSDDGEFADRFWLDLPHIVFTHCDMEKSGATLELEELLRVEDNEEEAAKRLNIDPYLLDYYGAKYRAKEENE